MHFVSLWIFSNNNNNNSETRCIRLSLVFLDVKKRQNSALGLISSTTHNETQCTHFVLFSYHERTIKRQNNALCLSHRVVVEKYSTIACSGITWKSRFVERTFFASCPIGTWGPRRDLRANLMICRFAKMNSSSIVKTPVAIIITIVTPDNSCVILARGARARGDQPPSIIITGAAIFTVGSCIATREL